MTFPGFLSLRYPYHQQHQPRPPIADWDGIAGGMASDEKHPNIHPVLSDFSDGLRLPT